MKLLMLKGLPGSGKSTWAKQFCAQQPGWVRINKDSLRDMMGNYRTGKDESLILKWRDALIFNTLQAGKNVIVDDTNFHPKHERRLKEIAEQCDMLYDIEFEIKFFDTPLAECIKNDLNRPVSVGEKVIKKMWRDYLAPKYAAPQWDNGKQAAIICDLDGTLAIHNGRSPYDMEKCDTDILCNEVASILTNMVGHIIFVSGREDKYREKTVKWLNEQFTGKPYELYMRPTDDRREDSIVKQELYERFIKGRYNIRFVLDDRNRVVDMWRRNGLKCFQVAEGDF